MKKRHTAIALILLITTCEIVTQPGICQNGVQQDDLLKKKQQEFLSWKFGMFMHFNMSTFHDTEWSNGHEDTLTFNPDQLDCGQWADAAVSAGMQYGVLTVKHTGGWCLWDSKYTKHDIARFSNYKNGKGDIIKEYVESFRSRGLKIGFYYCLPGNFSNRFGNKLECGQEDLHGLFPEAVGDFEWYIEKQVEELLTNYGPIDLFWFDQYSNPYTGKYWPELKALVHRLQPNCIVIANNSKDFSKTDIAGYEYPWLITAYPSEALPSEGNNKASEICDLLDERGWFWKSGSENVQPLEDVIKMIRLCNSRNANYLLDVPPDNHGLIPEAYVKYLKELGKEIK
jgi:alpha-L-fucosidase